MLDVIRPSLVELLNAEGNKAITGGLKGLQFHCARRKLYKEGQIPLDSLTQPCPRCTRLRLVCVRWNKAGGRPVLVPVQFESMLTQEDWSDPSMW